MKKKLAAFGVSLGLLAITVSGATASTEGRSPVSVDLSVSYSPYYYKWKEKGGVDEKGWLHGFEVESKIRSNRILWLPYLKPGFRIYGGDVKYDGKTWSGSEVKSRTDFQGWNAELEAGYDLRIGKNLTTSVYAGIGHEYWKRSIENTLTALGYSEKWSQNYLKLGVRPEYGAGRYYIYGDLYTKYPFDIKNRVSFFDVEVEPEKKLNYGVEVGGGIRGFLGKKADLFASVFYEREKFGKSDAEYSAVVGGELYQPESKRETYGLKIGIKF